MPTQIPLIPVSSAELTHAAYRLAQLHAQRDEAKASHQEACKEYKETMAVYDRAIAEQLATIRRAELEHKEGVSAEQLDVLFAQTKERQEEVEHDA